MRSSMVLLAAVLALAGCETGGRANCKERDDPLSAPSCRAEEKLAIAEPIVGLGFQDGYYAWVNRIDGSITAVDDTTLYIETELGPYVFRWQGSWPMPVAVGQQVSVEPNPDSHVVTIDGRSLAVFTPRDRINAWARDLCLEPSLGCRAAPLTYGLEFEVQSPFFQAKLPVGQTVQVGEWMISNPGVVHTPARVCDEVDEDFYVFPRFYPPEVSGQLLAWTLDPAVLQEDPAWCPGATMEGNRWPAGGPFGFELSTEGEWLAATVGDSSRSVGDADWVSLRVDDVFKYFKWPGSLPSPLRLADEVEIATLGEQSALRTASHLVWIIQTWTTPGQAIPGTPEVRYEPVCLLSNSSQLAAAVVSWEGESIRLLPGATAKLGPWTVVHHYGTSNASSGCHSDGSTWFRGLTTATRSLED